MSAFRSDLFGAVGSDLTSITYLTADAAEMTLAVDVDSATSVIVQGSNAQGFRTAFVEDDWSTLTTMAGLAANTLINIEPGFRWLRVVRESATSAPSAVLAGRNVVWGRG